MIRSDYFTVESMDSSYEFPNVLYGIDFHSNENNCDIVTFYWSLHRVNSNKKETTNNNKQAHSNNNFIVDIVCGRNIYILYSIMFVGCHVMTILYADKYNYAVPCHTTCIAIAISRNFSCFLHLWDAACVSCVCVLWGMKVKKRDIV